MYKFIVDNQEKLASSIVYDRDFSYDFFAFKTLERAYLLKLDNKIAERPQHMIMRVACGIHMDDIDRAIETYQLMSEKWFTVSAKPICLLWPPSRLMRLSDADLDALRRSTRARRCSTPGRRTRSCPPASSSP